MHDGYPELTDCPSEHVQENLQWRQVKKEKERSKLNQSAANIVSALQCWIEYENST